MTNPSQSLKDFFKVDKPWRDQGLPWPYYRNPHSFYRQRKVAGISAKPLYSRLLVTIIMQKKCFDNNVSFDIKENEAFDYLSSG